jgi:hypothetical protein
MRARELRQVSRKLHDRCLKACQVCRDQLTEPELRLLNEVIKSWNVDLVVSRDTINTVIAILTRLGL